MAWVFWLSVGAAAYVYAGYPCLLHLWVAYRGLRNADCGSNCGLRNAGRGLNCGLTRSALDQSTMNPQSALDQSTMNPQSALDQSTMNPQSALEESTINPQSAIRNPQCGAVSIVIAARNEAARLPARIDNLLGLDYPADKRQIVVVSDGSTD